MRYGAGTLESSGNGTGDASPALVRPIVAFLAAIGAHIDQLFVDPDHQRVGLGSALLGAMLERRLRPATLHVFAENTPARVFYERFGFRQVDAWWDTQDQALNLLYKLE